MMVPIAGRRGQGSRKRRSCFLFDTAMRSAKKCIFTFAFASGNLTSVSLPHFRPLILARTRNPNS
jgi:hypothetical protein